MIKAIMAKFIRGAGIDPLAKRVMDKVEEHAEQIKSGVEVELYDPQRQLYLTLREAYFLLCHHGIRFPQHFFDKWGMQMVTAGIGPFEEVKID